MTRFLGLLCVSVPTSLTVAIGPVRIISPERLSKGFRLPQPFLITLKIKVMKKVHFILGADISKKTIDFHCYQTNGYQQFTNNPKGFKQLIAWLRKQKISCMGLLIVMEHTGLYSYCFEEFLHRHQIGFTKVNALAIKLSAGIVRGKSDKLDARRIAEYGFEKQSKLLPQAPVPEATKQLQLLYSTRERLVRQRAALLNAVKEYTHMGLSKSHLIMKSQTKLIKTFSKEIKRLQDKMDAIIQNDPSLNQNYQLLQSVNGVGKVVALAMLIKTQNFTRFVSARKFACYCGTAPFEYSSGSSIRGKTRVNPMADKGMKTLLDLAAKVAIQYDKELKDYYEKRVAIGKPKMSTINIVRNKLLYRMFAVINRQTPFVENYLQAA